MAPSSKESHVILSSATLSGSCTGSSKLPCSHSLPSGWGRSNRPRVHLSSESCLDRWHGNQGEPASLARGAIFSPLQSSMFRALWLRNLVSAIRRRWSKASGAAWLMTTLAGALLQTSPPEVSTRSDGQSDLAVGDQAEAVARA